MSIDDDIKALRDKHPDILSEFTDKQIASEGFLQIPDSAMQEYAQIKSSYLKLPESAQDQFKSIQRARATLSPAYEPEPLPEPVVEEPPLQPEPPTPKALQADFNLNEYQPPPTYGSGYVNVFTQALDTIGRASRGDKTISAEDIEAAQSVVFNNRPGVNRSNFLMTVEQAEDMVETPGFLSPLGILEPFDYPRGTSWAGLSYLGDYLPETDTWIGQQLQDAAGFAGGLMTDLSLANPLGITPIAMTEDVGFGELVGRNLYEAASSGKLADAVTRFHGDGIPYIDTGYRLPNLTGPNVLDIVLPKAEMAKLRDKAIEQGATDFQVDILDKLATSDVARTIAGIVPEFVIDPLFFAGPAKAGQVILKGGKAIRVGSALGEASQAVSRATGSKADDIMRLGIDVVDGNAEALTTFRDTANKLEAGVQAKFRQADAFIAASKASRENQVRTATVELTNQIEDVNKTADPLRKVLTKAVDDAADPQTKAVAEQALQAFEEKMVRVVDNLAKTRATIGMDKDLAVNAERYLKSRAKALRMSAAIDNKSAQSINKFIKIAEDGSGVLGDQAVVNRGLNFHIPLTQKQVGVSIPFVGKNKGIRLRPLQGDTAASISAWTGVNVPDLAKLNNTTLEGLDEMISKGQKIVYQIGNKPSHMTQFLGLSLIPEGVVGAYLRGLTPAPIAENLGDFQRYFSGNNYQRIIDLESRNLPLSAGDLLSKKIYETFGGRLTAAADKFMELFATRFTQPLLASERLSRAVRFFENRDVKKVRQFENTRENAIIRLKTVAPDIWNAYQDATTNYLRTIAADTNRINSFMLRMMRQANEIAEVRKARGIESDGEEVMLEVMNAIESGQGQTLSAAELKIAEQITQEMKRIGDENGVEREAVRQSLLAMVRWVQSDPQTTANIIEEVRHLELLMSELTKRGVDQTDENLSKLNQILTKIKASKPKRGTPESASKKRLRDLTRQAIKDIKEIQKRLKKGESIEDIEILQRQVEPVAKPEPAAVPEPEVAAVPEPATPQAAIPEGFDLKNLPALTEDPALLKKLAKLPKSWQKAIDQLADGGELIDDSLTRSKYVRVVRKNKSNEQLTKFDRTVSNITANTLKELVDTRIIRKMGDDDYVLDPYNYFKSLLLRPKAKELVETLLDGGTLQSSKKIDDMFDTDVERALVGNTFVTGRLLQDGREVAIVVDNLGNEILTVPNDQLTDLLQKGRFATEFTPNPINLRGNPNTPDSAGFILRKTKLDTTSILKSETNNFKDLKLVDKAGKTVDLKTRKFVEELLNIGALKYLPEGNAGKGSFELAPDFMALRSRPALQAPKAADEVVKVFDDTAQQAEILGAAKKGVLEIQDEILKLTEEIARRGDAPPAPKLRPPEFKTPRGTSTSAMVRPLLNWEIDLFKQYRGIIDDANARRKAAGLEDLSEEAELRAVMSVFQDAPNALKRPEAFREATERYVTGKNPGNARLDVLPQDKAVRLDELNDQIDQILVKSPQQRTPDDKALLKSLRAQQDALYFEQWQLSGGFTPQFVGERFGALPDDIKDITESMSQMFEKYEDLFKQYGRDFTKDPFERMKLWGVVGYVPHMRKDFKNPIDEKLSFDRFSKGGLDKELSLNLDQAKQRKIQGLIAEINALPKGNTEQNWSFSVDPNFLIAHFVSGAKSLTNQDYLVAMLQGGVIRTFRNIDEAASQQYIPLFDRGEYARDMQILLLGSKGEISNLVNNKSGNIQNYITQFREALGNAIRNKGRLGEPESRPFKVWTDDLAEIRATDTVEQALSGINLHATVRDQDTFNVAQRHKEIVEGILQERRTKLENLLVKKNEALKKTSKDDDIAKFTEEISRLQLKLQETASDFQNAKARAERKAWDQVATEVNRRVASANNEREFQFQVFSDAGRLPNVSGKGLSLYMAKDQEMFRLYIPATVQESMSRVLEFSDTTGGVIGNVKKVSDALNNFWKARITVLSLAFTARNWVGNLFSNSLNIGVGGALDLSTNYQACLIGSLVDYHAKYGSIENALRQLSNPDRFKRAFLVDKGVDSKFMRLRERADLTALLKGLGIKDGQGLVDLGDGVMRPLDDILTDLTNRGVISGQSTYRVDSDEIAYQYQKLAAEMGVKESTGKTIDVKWSTAKTWLSNVEDTMYIGLPFIMGAPFVGMPKFLGQTIARRTENQGRMVNYIANIKQGRTADQATENVNKFLFDYSDLTATQKTWMRTLFPFFTWNQKNILLHAELMQTNPTYYADMYRFFYGTLPDISAAKKQEDEAAEGLDTPQVDARDQVFEKIRTGPKYRAYRVAVDVDPTNNIVIQGFGLPIEGFAQNVGTANDIMLNVFKSFGALTGIGKSKGRDVEAIKGLGSFGSQTNLLLRTLIEIPFSYDLFRQESVREGDNDYKKKYMLANDFGNLVQVLSQYSNPAVETTDIETAATQGVGHMMAKYIIDQLDMVPVYDGKEGKLNWYVQNPEKINQLRLMRMLPYERLLREAATAIDLNQTMYMTPEVYESGQATKFLDNTNAKLYRYISAYTGLKLKQDTDIAVQKQIFEQNVIQLFNDYHSAMIPGAKR